jgi:hypothetical protein
MLSPTLSARLKRLQTIDTFLVTKELHVLEHRLKSLEQSRKDLYNLHDAIRHAITHGKTASELRDYLPEFKGGKDDQ